MTTAKSASLLAELREHVVATVEHSPGSTVGDRLTAAARSLRLPRSRVADWWYREVRRVEAWEAETIRERALRAREDELRRMERELERLRAELAYSRPLDGVRPAAVAARPRRRRARKLGAAPA